MVTATQHLVNYFEQQLRLQRSSEIKYTTEEALIDAISVCKNAIEVEKSNIIQAFEDASLDVDKLGDVYYLGNYIKSL